MSSWQINPQSGDAIIGTNGSPIDSNRLNEPAFNRISIPRKRWMYAPDDKYGSDLYTLRKNAANGRAKQVSMVEQALQPIIDDGRALAIDVNPDSPQPTNRSNSALTATIIDAQGKIDVLKLPPIGV